MPGGERGYDTIRAIAAVIVAGGLLSALGLALWRAVAAQGIDVATLTLADVERFVAAWAPWSAAASVALMVLHSFLPLPAEFIPVVNGMMFGPWLGIALTWLGAMLGAALSFALARWLGRPFVRLVLSEAQWRRLDALPVGPGALLLARLMPLISFNLVNYAAGLLGIGWWTFVWTTAIGILPLTVAMVLLGRHMLAAPAWAWAVGVLALLAAWLLWRRWMAQRGSA
ncbi:MAG TPA: VTT domain-containing protein [Stellaceae bacterium]